MHISEIRYLNVVSNTSSRRQPSGWHLIKVSSLKLAGRDEETLVGRGGRPWKLGEWRRSGVDEGGRPNLSLTSWPRSTLAPRDPNSFRPLWDHYSVSSDHWPSPN